MQKLDAYQQSLFTKNDGLYYKLQRH